MLTARDIALLLEALTQTASRHTSQAKAGHRPAYHKRRASEMRALGSKLLMFKVVTRRKR